MWMHLRGAALPGGDGGAPAPTAGQQRPLVEDDGTAPRRRVLQRVVLPPSAFICIYMAAFYILLVFFYQGLLK